MTGIDFFLFWKQKRESPEKMIQKQKKSEVDGERGLASF